MRELEIGSKNHTTVKVADEPSFGGACHEYYIGKAITRGQSLREPDVPAGEFGHVFFQKGPIRENGVNGCHHEDIIAIVIDRLQSFQAGDFKCRENALAITKLEEALHWLNHRTAERSKRGVEGLNVK
jgi:hypothetical protein